MLKARVNRIFEPLPRRVGVGGGWVTHPVSGWQFITVIAKGPIFAQDDFA